jgi:hypothetical protein
VTSSARRAARRQATDVRQQATGQGAHPPATEPAWRVTLTGTIEIISDYLINTLECRP